jgi:hypothetical protein
MPRGNYKGLYGALGHHFQMFNHMSVDEVCRKFEKLLPIHENGANQCICQVKVVLTRLDMQVHHKVIKIVIFHVSS